MSTGFIWDERFAWFDTSDLGRGPFFTPLRAFNTRERGRRSDLRAPTEGTTRGAT